MHSYTVDAVTRQCNDTGDSAIAALNSLAAWGIGRGRKNHSIGTAPTHALQLKL